MNGRAIWSLTTMARLTKTTAAWSRRLIVCTMPPAKAVAKKSWPGCWKNYWPTPKSIWRTKSALWPALAFLNPKPTARGMITHFVAELVRLKELYEGGSPTVATRLSQLLRDWLSLHIRRNDKEVRLFLDKQRRLKALKKS